MHNTYRSEQIGNNLYKIVEDLPNGDVRRVTTPDGRQALTKGEADGFVESFNDAKKARGDIADAVLNSRPDWKGVGVWTRRVE